MVLPCEPAGASRTVWSLRHASTRAAFRPTFGDTSYAWFGSVLRPLRSLGIHGADREANAEDVVRVVRGQVDACGVNNPGGLGPEGERGGGGLMETMGDDSFTLRGRLLTDFPVAAQPTWVRARAIDLLRSLDEFQVPTSRKQRLLLRLRPGSPRRTFVWLLPLVVGAFLMGIGGGIATAALTKWSARVVRSYRKLRSTPSHSGSSPSALALPEEEKLR